MLSYSFACTEYIELAGDAWVAVLCQTSRTTTLADCSDFHTHSNGTLESEAFTRMLMDRGDRKLAQHTSGIFFGDAQLTNYAMRGHTLGTAEALLHGEEAHARTRFVRMARLVLNETALSSVGRMLARAMREEIEVRDQSDGGGCLPSEPGERCVWGAAVESEPEGLHQSSADVQMEFRELGLVFIIHRRRCRSGGGRPARGRMGATRPSPSLITRARQLLRT